MEINKDGQTLLHDEIDALQLEFEKETSLKKNDDYLVKKKSSRYD